MYPHDPFTWKRDLTLVIHPFIPKMLLKWWDAINTSEENTWSSLLRQLWNQSKIYPSDCAQIYLCLLVTSWVEFDLKKRNNGIYNNMQRGAKCFDAQSCVTSAVNPVNKSHAFQVLGCHPTYFLQVFNRTIILCCSYWLCSKKFVCFQIQAKIEGHKSLYLINTTHSLKLKSRVTGLTPGKQTPTWIAWKRPF